MQTANDPDDLNRALLEIVGRRFFHLISQAADASLISKWYDVCDASFDTEELQKLIEQGRDVVNAKSEEFEEPPTPVALAQTTDATPPQSVNAEWKPQMQPIEVIVDESAGDFEADNQPSTSSSVISAHADTQQDAKVYTRIGELRSAGLWSATRLPMCVEPPRPKLHWDFLLEEVLWMSSDFRQERRIKRRLARKLCSEARQQWKRKFDTKLDEKTVQEKEAKRVCASVARMVKEFWFNVDKVVDFRTKEILDSQKRKALDQHLTFLVGEADKLSTLLHERLVNASPEPPLPTSSAASTSGKRGRPPARQIFTANNDDDVGEEDFNAHSSDEDDERTIAQEEKRLSKGAVESELNELSQLADMDDDDFFNSLPKGYLERFYRGGRIHPEEEAVTSCADDMDTLPTADNDGDDEADEAMDASTSSAATRPSSSMTAKSTTAEEAAEESTAFSDEPPDLKVDYTNLNSDNSEVRRRELNNIAEVALEFQPKGYTLETTQVKTEVPFLIRGTLREYQLVGLDWLVTLYEKNLNGILADEMGLGKTIQTVALLAHLACEKMVWGPHLIIVPTSVILNWEMELKKWCPSFKILTYFGSAKERAEKRKGWTKNNAFHVCITSYKVASQDIKSLKSKAWQYIILDEAQNIKNFKSQRWRTLLNIRSRRRLLLTGTPLQNSLMELWSLLHFLMPSVFASHEDFKDWFSNPMSSMVEGNMEVDNALVQRLHKVLRPFILRRLKSEVERQLPTKQEKVIACTLSKRQRFLYNEFLSRRDTRDNLQSGNMMSVLNVIMQLRKCCNHPNLFEPRPVVSPFVAPPMRLTLPKMFLIDLLRDPVVEKCYEGDERPSLCTLSFNAVSRLNAWQLFERVSDASTLCYDDTGDWSMENLPKLNGLKFSVDSNAGGATFYKISSVKELELTNGVINVKEVKPLGIVKNGRKRSAAVMLDAGGTVTGSGDSKKLSQKVSNISTAPPAKRVCRFENICMQFRQDRATENRKVGVWLTTKCRTVGAPAIAHETICILQRMMREARRDLQRKSVISATCRTKFSSSFASRLSSRILSTSHFSSNDGSAEVMAMLADEDGGRFGQICQVISSRISDWLRSSIKSFLLYVNKVFCEGPRLSVNRRAMDQFNESMCELVSKRIFSRRSDESEIIRISHQMQFPELRLIEYDCGKLQTLSKLLHQLYENKHRCLIFTQMSRMLDILQAFLSYHSYKYFRLDGSTHIDQRQAMMERFNNDSTIFCFILSTRSGGVGVNLTGADTVIFYDSDWNPTMDAQAQDRCHRIGQTRNVTIYRLISENTIEENILKKATQKRRLGEMALDEAEFTPEFFRSTDNIRDLFSNEESVAEIVAPFASGTKEIEMAMANAEDQQDVLAAKLAQAEASADVAEFDENAAQAGLPSSQHRPSSSQSQGVQVKSAASISGVGQSKYLQDIDNASEQYIELISSMTPVERYAIAFLENEYRPELEEEVKEAAALIEAKKEDYLKQNGETQEMDVDENGGVRDGMGLMAHDTYDEDFLKEVFPPEFCIDAIPTWMPPSPPNSEAGDVLLDAARQNVYYTSLDDYAFALYEPRLIPESKLPPLPPQPPPIVALRRGGIVGGAPNAAARLAQAQRDRDRKHRHNLSHSTSRQNSLASSKGAQKDGRATPPLVGKQQKHLRRQIATTSELPSKKSRHHQRSGEGLIDEKLSVRLHKSVGCVRRSETPGGGSHSPSRVGTPAGEYATAQKIPYDAAMIAALNSAGAAITSRSDGPQKIDESIERVRRNSTQKTQTPQPHKTTCYVSSGGVAENRHDVLYYPGSSAAIVPPFSRRVGPSGEIVAPHGGFAMPAAATGEADDDDGMRWSTEEDARLCAGVILHSKVTPQMLGECWPALEFNWEYVSHYLNIESLQYRSPRQCCYRYKKVFLKISRECEQGAPTSIEQNVYQKLQESLNDYVVQPTGSEHHQWSVSSGTAYHENMPRPPQSSASETWRCAALKPPMRRYAYFDEAARERENTTQFQRRSRAALDAAVLRPKTDVYLTMETLSAQAVAFAARATAADTSATSGREIGNLL